MVHHRCVLSVWTGLLLDHILAHSQNPTGNQALPCSVMQVCVDCIGDNCLPQCHPASSNPYHIDNTISGENYTVRLSLVNGIGRSELSDPLLFGEAELTFCYGHAALFPHYSVELCVASLIVW